MECKTSKMKESLAGWTVEKRLVFVHSFVARRAYAVPLLYGIRIINPQNV
jgi:hypothetical protein